MERPDFTVVLRGYDVGQVDQYLAALDGRPAVEPPQFTIRMRGYDVRQVDGYLAALADGQAGTR